MYSSEVYPQEYREVGMSLAVAINLSFAGALAMAVPQYQKRLSESTQSNQHLLLLGSFAALDFTAAILVWLFMRYPERAVELEDMNVCIDSGSSLTKGILELTLSGYSLCSVHPRWSTYIIRSRLHGTEFGSWNGDRVLSIGRKSA